MSLDLAFKEIALSDIVDLAASRRRDGWRFVQILAVNTEDGIDLVYTFMKDGLLANYKVLAVQKSDAVPSITDTFLEAFVFENEIHDLFGVHIEGIAIDFGGNFYATAQKEPMTIISPAQKEAREKAKKAEAARRAKAEAATKKAQEAPAAAAVDDAAALEAKLAGMDPEKAAKVRAAMEARAKKAAAQKEGE